MAAHQLRGRALRGMRHGLQEDGRRSRLNVAMRRLPWLALLATAVTCGPVVGTAAADDPPTILGNTQVGTTLSLSDPLLGGDLTTNTYQWEDCDSAGANCIPVAANGTSSTYTLQTTDVGSTIEATINVTDLGSSTTTTSVGPVAPLVASPWVPSPGPAITGTVLQGQTLSVSTGTWGTDPTTTTFTYQWESCDAVPNCSVVGTSSSYKLQGSDVGHTIVAMVSANDSFGDVSAPSSSATLGPVVSDATTTTLAASPKSAQANQTVTLIATVSSSAGAPAPAGAITVRNGATPIGSCTSLPVNPTGQIVTVVCPASFATSTGKLTAVFAPTSGSSLQGSTSGAVGVTITAAPSSPPTTNSSPPTTSSPGTGTVTVVQAPAPASAPSAPGVPAAVTSTMQWTFYYTPSFTQIRALIVNGVPAHATVLVKCHGKGCPFAHHTMVVARMKRCGTKKIAMCLTHGAFDLTPGFAKRHLAPGTQITIVISRPKWIAKYYAFTVQARHAPRIRIACLAPGGTHPGQGC
jgi:hypothetical protein